MGRMTLGIDVACRAAHQASLADEAGRLPGAGGGSAPARPIWSGCGRGFRPAPS
jgi:hypothetical protein